MEGSQLFRSAYKDGKKQELFFKYFCCRKKDTEEEEKNNEKNKFIGGKWPNPI